MKIRCFQRLLLLLWCLTLSVNTPARKKQAPPTDREYWCAEAYRLSQPVLESLAAGELRQRMEIEVAPTWGNNNRNVAYLECFGRLMSGIAPWLALPADSTVEGKQRLRLHRWALAAYRHAVDPESPDLMMWKGSSQVLVDAAFLAQSFLRAYDALWLPLDSITRRRYVEVFTRLRTIEPNYSNWLLFSATIETFLAKAGAPYDIVRINSAIRKMEEWYVGDGWYSDGPHFAVDYYGSYVIHPMYLEVLQTMAELRISSRINYTQLLQKQLRREQRFAILLERLISPEGTFPPLGRSSTYRMAALQPLAQLAWQGKLPSELPDGQVRTAITQVMHRMYDHQENYNPSGFLTIGFCGSQPDLADSYTNNGSLYMTSMVFMPLGLPAEHPFWSSPSLPTTQTKAWNGQAIPRDHRWGD